MRIHVSITQQEDAHYVARLRTIVKEISKILYRSSSMNRICCHCIVSRMVIRLIPPQYGQDTERLQKAKNTGSHIEKFRSKTSEATRASHKAIDGVKVPGRFHGIKKQTN